MISATTKAQPRFLRRIQAIASATALTFALAACSDSDENISLDAEAANNTIKLVASTPVWGDIAKDVIAGGTSDSKDSEGTTFEVVTIMENIDDNPHDYEPSPRNLAQLEDADVVIANGGGYDNWLTNNAGDLELVTAMPLADDHDRGHNHGDVTPHAWLDMDIVNAFADNLAKQLNELDSNFPTDASKTVKEKTARFSQRLQDLPVKKVILTESVAGEAVKNSQLEDVTPAAYAQAVNTESEPSAADLATTRDLISQKGKVDILITNQQAQTPAAQQLVNAAEDNDVKVINLNETPDQGDSYYDYVDKFITELEEA